MKVSFEGKWFDVDNEEDELRAAARNKAIRLITEMSPLHKQEALVELFTSATLIAVKFGATAGMHHAYAVPVDYEIVDTYAHILNKLVGLNYVPPEQVNRTEENDSGTTEEG